MKMKTNEDDNNRLNKMVNYEGQNDAKSKELINMVMITDRIPLDVSYFDEMIRLEPVLKT